MQQRYLVIGLESSCTRIVSKLIALNLGIIESLDDWDAYEAVSNKKFLVQHKSLPHHNRDNFPDSKYAKSFDHIILATRDFNASLISKINNHQSDVKEAKREHYSGIDAMLDIYKKLYGKVIIFSYETAFLLGDTYVSSVLSDIGIRYEHPVKFTNINQKYFKQEEK